MTTLQPKTLTEAEKEDAIDLFRKEQDERAWGKPPQEIRCPTGKRRAIRIYVKGIEQTIYKFAVCDCPRTSESIGLWPYNCTIGSLCPTRKILFPNGTFS